MKRKIAALILSAGMILNFGITPMVSYADNEQTVSYSLSSEDETLPFNQEQNSVVQNLIEQTEGKYRENQEVTVIVEVNDKTMSEKYGLDVADISNVKTKEGLKEQLEYAKESQDALIGAIDSIGADYKIVESYDTVLNAVAIKTNLEDAKKIAALPEVTSMELNRTIKAPELEKVNISKTLDQSSNEMIKASEAWSRLYSGKGQLIAVLDSGADPEHEVFKQVDTSVVRIKNEMQMKSIISAQDISPGKYFNAKIPFGFNYADRNTKIKENKKSSHGMHVAGIVAANSEKLKGVAPDAQLVIMRVFGESAFGGGTTPVIYNKAIDDAVKMGVDSINMSLGSTGTTDGRMEQTTINALKKAQEAGIVVAIAIGNDGFMGFGAIDAPPSTNPDIGLTNSPAVEDVSVAVASVDNIKVRQKGIVLNTDPIKRILFMPSGDEPFTDEAKEFVHVNEAYPEDFENVNVSGKIALIKRGDKPDKKADMSFAQKVKNAQEKGAIAAIVYNNVDERQLVHMAGFKEEGVTIPSYFISKDDGELLIANQGKTIKIETQESFIANPNGYKISVFSSWGVSPEGNLKPDISAPGGQIYSSLNDNTYDLMSGTSMATPHVAGGIAVVKEYVEKTFPNVRGSEKHKLIKNILMSTASPHKDEKTGAYTSPRAQGAGLLNLSRAIHSGVVVLGTNDISSINLRNIEGNTVRIAGKLKNYTNSEKTFSYYAELNTDTVRNGKTILQPKLIESTENNKKSITVSANSQREFEVTFSLTDEQINEFTSDMPNGFFLEGYVFFESELPYESISVPFVGFRGNWEKLKVIEDSIYDLLSQNKRPYYYERADKVKNPFTYIASKAVGEDIALGELQDNTFENPKYDKNKIAFSPNGDGKADEINFAGTFLRNYKDFAINVYTAEDEEKTTAIYNVSQQDDFGVKNYFISSPFGGPNLNHKKSHWKWNGRNYSSEVMPDGKYIFSVSVKPDGSSEKLETQTMDFPILIDTVYPRIVESSYDMASGVYTLSKVEEKGSGIKNMEIKIGEQVYKANESGVFNLPENTDPQKATISVSDYAYNTIELPLNKSIRRGNEKTVIINPIIATGSVPVNKFKWSVFDSNNELADPYDLKVGDYTLVITNVEEPFELSGPNSINFSIKEDDTDKIISVPFNYKNKKEVTVNISKSPKVTLKVIMIDILSGVEYELSPKSKTQYATNLPEGTYKTVVRDLSDDYYAIIEPKEIVVTDKGVIGINPSITVTQKNMKEVTVNLNRGDYDGSLTVVLRGNDHIKTTYMLDFAQGENSKKINLPIKLKFDVYVTSIEGYGIENKEYTPSLPIKPLEINLIKGIQAIKVPIEKEALQILVNKANLLKEADYEVESWSKFEKLLDKAEKILKNKDANQLQVNEIEKELQNAMNELVSKNAGDKLKLKEKIEECEAIFNSLDESYDEKSKEFLQIAIEGAKLTYKSKEPQYNTKKHIEDTINMLNRAIKNLKRKDGKVDKSGLAVLLKQAEEIIKNENLYTKESIDDLKKAYQLAKADYENPDVDARTVENHISDLTNYLSLILSKADRTELKKEIDISSQVDLSKYKIDGRAEFRVSLQKAKETLANNRVLQKEIDDAYKDLKQKREALVLKGHVSSELFNVPIKVTDKNSKLSLGNDFVNAVAKVEKTEDNEYTYKISLKSVEFELNGKTIKSDINKLSIITASGKQVLSGKVNNDVVEYVFESNRELSEQKIEFSIDVLEELGEDEIQAFINFDWSKATK